MPWNWDCKPWANWNASSHPAEMLRLPVSLSNPKGMEPVRLGPGRGTIIRFRFAGIGREFSKGYTETRTLKSGVVILHYAPDNDDRYARSVN